MADNLRIAKTTTTTPMQSHHLLKLIVGHDVYTDNKLLAFN